MSHNELMKNEGMVFTLSPVLVFIMNIRFLPIARVCSPHPPPPAPGSSLKQSPAKETDLPSRAPPTGSSSHRKLLPPSLSLCAGQIPGTTSALVRNWKPPSDQPEEQGQDPSAEPRPRARAFLAEVKQMRARRKTAKMLMVVLLVFALCYLPISVLNVLKR